MYVLTMLTVYEMSGFVHAITYIKLPTILEYETQDIYSHSLSVYGDNFELN